ncbi:YbhB/YbcL family Raf kinase inhibitor-like protein [Salinactinospora qingdaonensis]|uniref:YbhB/YbcL family Raf kinase inhibitor-like protein n=1 Tax=Salinactinospora qingdaonensis TaxID=702744 RepID=A0ABP7G3J6_9ACTN
MPLNIADLSISCRQFDAGERIPDLHSADHGNVAPDLKITGVPEGTVELAVIMHDPDAPLPRGFVHWVCYGIAPSTTWVEGAGSGRNHREGPNTLGEKAYSGPQPPPGHGTHHYYFWVYALNTAVKGEPTREEFLADYAEAIIEQNRVVGTYSS